MMTMMTMTYSRWTPTPNGEPVRCATFLLREVPFMYLFFLDKALFGTISSPLGVGVDKNKSFLYDVKYK